MNVAREIRDRIQALYPGASVVERRKGSIRHQIGPNKFAVDAVIGSLHYGPSSDQEIDTAWTPAVSPWNYQMLANDYNARLVSRFDAGMIARYTDATTGEYVEFQPQNLQYSNDLDQIQSIGIPQNVNATVTDNTAYWTGAYGPGRDFSWTPTPDRLEKWLKLLTPASLPIPTSTIRNGGNPVVELNIVFRRSAGVELWIDGAKWNEAANNPKTTANRIEFRQTSTGTALWWIDLPMTVDAAGEQVVGTFRLKKQGPSLYVSIRVPLSWIEDVARVWPISIDTTVDKQTAASGDDGRRYTGTQGFVANDASIYLGHSTNAAILSCHGFARWTGVTIGGTIDVSYVSYLWLGDGAGTPLLKVSGVDEDNPAAPTSAAEFDADPLTTAGVDWDGAWSGTWNNSPSLNAIFTELVASYTITDDAVMVQIKDDGGTGLNLNGYKTWDYAGNVSGPKLHIEYTAGIAIAPAALAIPVGIPAPTISLGAKALAPSALAVPVAMPAPVLSYGALALAPTPVAIPTSLPAPALSFGALAIAPTPVAIPVAIPTPALTFGAISLTPDPVAVPLVVAVSALTFGAIALTPDPVAVPVATPSPALSVGAVSLAPDALAILTVVPTPGISQGAKALVPDAVPIPVVIPTPALSQGAKALSPDALAVPLAIPAPSLSMGAIAISPDPVAIPVIIPAPAVTSALSILPDALAIPVVIPAPALSFGTAAITPTPVTIPISILAPVVTLSALAVSPDPLPLPLALPAPVVTFGAIALAPDPVAIPVIIPAPTISVGAIAIIPDPVPVPVLVAVPALTFGPIALTPTPVAILLTVPAVTIQIGILPVPPTPVVPGGGGGRRTFRYRPKFPLSLPTWIYRPVPETVPPPAPKPILVPIPLPPAKITGAGTFAAPSAIMAGWGTALPPQFWGEGAVEAAMAILAGKGGYRRPEFMESDEAWLLGIPYTERAK